MKNRIRQQLSFFQSEIERRLESENEKPEDDGRPVLRGTGAMYEVASRVRAITADSMDMLGARRIPDPTTAVGFVFGYDSSKNLVEEADSLPETAWKKLDRESRKIKTQPRARPENVRNRIVKERGYLKISLVEVHYTEIRYRPRNGPENFALSRAQAKARLDSKAIQAQDGPLALHAISFHDL